MGACSSIFRLRTRKHFPSSTILRTKIGAKIDIGPAVEDRHRPCGVWSSTTRQPLVVFLDSVYKGFPSFVAPNKRPSHLFSVPWNARWTGVSLAHRPAAVPSRPASPCPTPPHPAPPYPPRPALPGPAPPCPSPPAPLRRLVPPVVCPGFGSDKLVYLQCCIFAGNKGSIAIYELKNRFEDRRSEAQETWPGPVGAGGGRKKKKKKAFFVLPAEKVEDGKGGSSLFRPRRSKVGGKGSLFFRAGKMKNLRPIFEKAPTHLRRNPPLPPIFG